ncbi:MAG TPA: hypothetical protein VFP61_15750 [Acidimicrobiales bacterium]|nr:hypothetical protein [Acidimicrobiales bacterium]
MSTYSDADHALGLELQLEELVEQRTRAEVQGRPDDARGIQEQIDRLTDELAATAEHLADEGPAAAKVDVHAPRAVEIPD